MGMPQIPPREHRPGICEVVAGLIEAVAIEELAIAHIINAEGEKLQEVVKKFAYCNITFDELEKVCSSTNSLMNSLIMKEWILLSKMNSALNIYEVMEGDCDPHHRCKCHEHKCRPRRCDCDDNSPEESLKFNCNN